MSKKMVVPASIFKNRFWNVFYSFLIFLFVFFLVLQFFRISEFPEKVVIPGEVGENGLINQSNPLESEIVSKNVFNESNISGEKVSFYVLSGNDKVNDVLARASAGLSASVLAKSAGMKNPGGYVEPSFLVKGSIGAPLPRDIFKNTPISCGAVSQGSGNISFQESELGGVSIPAGFSLVSKPFSVDCAGQSLDLSVNVPQNFVNISVLRCVNSVCRTADKVNSSVDEVVCGGLTASEARKKQVEMRPKFFAPSYWDFKTSVDKSISNKSSFVVAGNYFFDFSGMLNKSFFVRVSSPLINISAPINPDFYFVGTPMVLKLVSGSIFNVSLRVRVSYPILDNFDMSSLAFYYLVGNRWKQLDTKVDNGVVVFESKDLSKLFGSNKSVVLGVMGLLCNACDIGRLEKVYDGGTRDAVILVHGLFSSPATWQNFIDDYVINKQPVQLWTLSYPSGQSTDFSARQFVYQLKLHENEFDNIYFVAHSFGGFVVHNSLKIISDQKSSLLSKIRRVIMIGTPHQGTPILKQYNNFFKYIINSNEGAGLFDVKGAVADELTKGMNISRIIPEDYFVIAGNKSYSFDFGVFRVSATDLFNFSGPNDGVTSVVGAQHMHDDLLLNNSVIINDSCKNSFVFPVTHTELTTYPATRRIVSRIIFDDLSYKNYSMPLVGFNRYVSFQIKGCLHGEKYVLIGKKVPLTQVEFSMNCYCGDHVCGVGENKFNCPQDCVK